MFWDGDYKDGRFQPPTGMPQEPKDGVRLYEDEKGVPVVYGDSAYDVWFGAGDAADYDAMFAALPQSSKEVIEGYAAGLDAWIAHVRTTPRDLPAE